MAWPLILDATGAALSLLQPQEYPENIGAEFRSEGVESEEISKLPSEEVEVSEQASEVLGEVLGWKECVVVLRGEYLSSGCRTEGYLGEVSRGSE